MSHPFALLFEKEVEKPAPAVRGWRRERFVVGKSQGEWGTAGGSSFLFMSLHLSSRFKYVNYPLGLAAGVCVCAPRLEGRGAPSAFLAPGPHPNTVCLATKANNSRLTLRRP